MTEKQIAQLRALIPAPLQRGLGHVRDRLVSAITRTPDYDHDGMRLHGKNTEFLRDPRFQAAYRAGMSSGHKICRHAGSSDDIHIEWRAHICCWAAWHAKQLPGDFVECGVNTGILSLAVCDFIDFNATGKRFLLFDTFRGIPEEQMLPSERQARIAENAAYYAECYDRARQNFARFPRAVLVRGTVPDTLASAAVEEICYLHLDMNIAYPEVAAIEYFWDKLVRGAAVIWDDYGFVHYEAQKHAMDAFAARKGVRIATLPTGQGLLIKA